jgi:hypothetical protein
MSEQQWARFQVCAVSAVAIGAKISILGTILKTKNNVFWLSKTRTVFVLDGSIHSVSIIQLLRL